MAVQIITLCPARHLHPGDLGLGCWSLRGGFARHLAGLLLGGDVVLGLVALHGGSTGGWPFSSDAWLSIYTGGDLGPVLAGP